ncbi:PAS domain S-box-containing protein [Albimonas donghaensis]|uniref:histidine kinase n=1 Tax=Albimonas donghaensis TaxID=356660 RepID=A0A1H2RBJ5_9RHOB|nr:PAS domain S-box protein [Albimonas donghaensis]SDW16812.1 PAS domain S-box-containing protein [Albimonas donghaensis]
MPEDEALLRALAQLERRRTREAAALREANALLAGLERMTAADGPAEALAALLDALRGALGCDATAVLTPEGGDLVFAHAAGLRLAGWLPGAAEAVGAAPARLDDLSEEPWWPGDRRGVDHGSDPASPQEPAAGRPDRPPASSAAAPRQAESEAAAGEPPPPALPPLARPGARDPLAGLPPAMAARLAGGAGPPASPAPEAETTAPGSDDAPMRAWISAPVPAEDGAPPSVLACLSRRAAGFGDDDLRLVARFAGLAAQVLANHALAERNALLAAVVEGSSASVVIAEASGHAPSRPASASRGDFPLIYVNRAFETLTGWSRAEALGRDCRFLSAEPPDSPERARLRQAMQDGATGRFVLRNRARDGRAFWNELSLHPILDADGRIDKIVATQVDVTERMKAERDRDRARSRLINALASLGQGFLLLDDRGRVVFANPPYRDFFAPGDAPWAPGRRFEDVWAARLAAQGRPEDAARAEARARLEGMRAGRAEREETLPDGRILLMTEQPAPDGGCMSMAVDVTRLKTSERMLAGRAAAMDAAQDGIAIADEAGRIVYMNPAHRAMFGFEDESAALGRPWLDLYAPDRADWLVRRILPELETRGAWRGELKGRRRDGGAVDQEVSLTLVEGFGLVCVSRDTAERRRAEAEQARLRDQLHAAQRHEAIGVLAAGIAHDFNNLLSAITGSAAMIAGAVPPAAAERRHAERILAAGGRAADLVSRLLAVGRRPAPRAESDLRAALDDATDLVRAGLPTQIDLHIEAAETPLRARIDPTDFLQVLLNLVINARDAMTESGAAGVISVVLDAAMAPEPGDDPTPSAEPGGAASGGRASPQPGGGALDASLARAAHSAGTAPAALSPPSGPAPAPVPAPVLAPVLGPASAPRFAPAETQAISASSAPGRSAVVDPLCGAPALRLSAAPAGTACARLRVRDTGCGIPPDRIREIFEPYFTTKGGAGTGLGLSVLASLVQGAGGGLALRSREGVGTEFEVLWPLARPDAAAAPAPSAVHAGGAGAGAMRRDAEAQDDPAARTGRSIGSAAMAASSSTPAAAPPFAPPAPDLPAARPLAGALALVVDDDPAAAETLGALLESAGAEAAICQHPADALDALGEDPGAWRLLVTDFEMPGQNGADVAEAARRLAPGLPVLLCTGLGFEAVRRAGGEGLFDAVLPKPIDPDRLIAACARAIAARSGLAASGAPVPPDAVPPDAAPPDAASGAARPPGIAADARADGAPTPPAPSAADPPPRGSPARPSPASPRARTETR